MNEPTNEPKNEPGDEPQDELKHAPDPEDDDSHIDGCLCDAASNDIASNDETCDEDLPVAEGGVA